MEKEKTKEKSQETKELKEDKDSKKTKKLKDEKKRSAWSLQSISILLLIVLIALVLIIIQVPYTSTNAVKEIVQVEKCKNFQIPFYSVFKTGLKYSTSLGVDSSEGVALAKYTELGPYVFANIRNVGDSKGDYCLDIEAYYIEKFNPGKNKIDSFNEIVDDLSLVKDITSKLNPKQILPLCTENKISPTQTDTISIWASSILSEQAKEDYDLNKVYILFKVVAPNVEKCQLEDVEQEVEKEVTLYCNAWKHVVGKC